ncbi:Virulence protein [Thalassovita gelatinovora]|uniref:Virulence protein n=1 Tax=Thalassovita gelatinovora TaxID=53501 RepID=A0A0P1F5V3_THAGE|nr:VOC family protein [Thalassovita gelatinovora]QIZ80835.1 VOC family protein [Thalassovita gelatinovora]CUH63259.1 Virulence protein [Thalassovita gelatinovora]SEQ64204.1 Catechol 2,3-dioxygenase [Thalassovita gelatinovora]
MAPELAALDHLVLTVADLSATVAFYSEVLGMRADRFDAVDDSSRWALYFGTQKINLHQAGAEFLPKARHAAPGSADLCFLSQTRVADWARHLVKAGVEIELGPVRRSGATGPILSIYLRDPDGNLIEISNLV